MQQSPKILFVIASALFVGGVGLAVTQPGDLGDEETAALDTTVDATTSSTTMAPSSTVAIGNDPAISAPTTTLLGPVEQSPTTTFGSAGEPSTTTTTPTTAAPTTAAPTTAAPATLAPTTVPIGPSSDAGSGLGAIDGPAAIDTVNGLADTGAESLLLAALVAAGAGAVTHRRTR